MSQRNIHLQQAPESTDLHRDGPQQSTQLFLIKSVITSGNVYSEQHTLVNAIIAAQKCKKGNVRLSR
jgi:hypothetical protein